MIVLMALLIGILFAGAIYLMLRRHVVQLLAGLILLNYGVMLLVFTIGGLQRGVVPVVEREQPRGSIPGVPYPQPDTLPQEGPLLSIDPVPQILVVMIMLTSFSIMLCMLALGRRMHERVGSSDLDDMASTDMV